MSLFKLLFVVSIVTVVDATVFAQTETENINNLIDSWHKAAAEADAKIFFGTMAQDAIYIGTDSTERWTKSEFEAFAKPFFERGKAWDFKPIERGVYFAADKNTAWFDETLQTWMGVCRASGVLTKSSENKWQIAHYHLSVTVPNEKIQLFIGLMKSDKTDKTKK